MRAQVTRPPLSGSAPGTLPGVRPARARRNHGGVNEGGVPSPDRHDLERFVAAQDPIWDRVQAELRRGRKSSHWMWFVFPQIAGLGSSPTARAYALSGLDEARAYLAHPVLGPRLREAAQLAAAVPAGGASEVFGYPDDLKLRSSMTLFARAAPEEPVFTAVLDRYFDGDPDPRTLDLLQ
jgi:uncharacterized protein (DUF1810 family)